MPNTHQTTKDKVREALTAVFSLRLKALIPCETPEKIVSHFLEWMEQLSRDLPNNHQESHLMMDKIHHLLYFKNDMTDLEARQRAIHSAIGAIHELITYVEKLYTRLCKEYVSTDELAAAQYDIRKAVGWKLNSCLEEKGMSIDRQGIINQVSHMTLNRINSFHAHTQGDSKNYEGYLILTGYDILMSCLIYSFYHMVFLNSNPTE